MTRAAQRTRRVWAAITADPRASIRGLQQRCGLSSTSVVCYQLRKLERLGYIRRAAGKARAIVVVVGFVEVGR